MNGYEQVGQFMEVLGPLFLLHSGRHMAYMAVLHGIVWTILVFLSHFPIDRWSLADKWLDSIDGRSLRDFIKNGNENIPEEFDRNNYHALRASFTGLVYCAVDNTMHLLLMYFGAIYLNTICL